MSESQLRGSETIGHGCSETDFSRNLVKGMLIPEIARK